MAVSMAGGKHYLHPKTTSSKFKKHPLTASSCMKTSPNAFPPTDPQWFAKLHADYGAYVATVIRNQIPGISEPDVKDIQQEVYFIFWRKVVSCEYQEQGNAKAYLARIAVNCCYEWLRRRKKEEAPFDPSDPPPPEAEDDHIEQEYLEQLKSKHLQAMAECLQESENPNKPYLLRHEQNGEKIKDIASELGRTEGAMRQALSDLRRQLRLCRRGKLAKWGFVP